MHVLKPFDVVVALKIGLNEKKLREYLEKINKNNNIEKDESSGSSNSVGDLALSLHKGKGDVSRSINRLLKLGLVGERRPKNGDPVSANRKFYSLQRSAISDLLCYGIRLMFGPERLGVGRGVPTGWSCPYIKSAMNPPEMPLVWAMPGGDVRGELLEPIYTQAPQAAQRDDELYALLALIDVLRTGKPRELAHAKEALANKITELHS
jgi:DNA-binding MarR family transcriptional regulator